MKILLVDDDTMILDVLNDILSVYSPLMSLSGTEAIEIAKKEKPDLIFLDVNIPDISGYEVCKTIKSSADMFTKIIFISGNGDIEDRMKGYSHGADDFIVKPFEAEEIIAKVEVYKRLIQSEKTLQIKNEQLKKLALQLTDKNNNKENQKDDNQKDRISTLIPNSFEFIKELQEHMIAVRGYSAVLTQKFSDEVIFQKIKKSIDQMENLLRSTIFYQNFYNKNDVLLNEIISDELKFLSLTSKNKKQIKTHLELHELPQFIGNRGELSEVFHLLFKLIYDDSIHSNSPSVSIKTSTNSMQNLIRVEIVQSESSRKIERTSNLDFIHSLNMANTILKKYGGLIKMNNKQDECFSFIITYILEKNSSSQLVA